MNKIEQPIQSLASLVKALLAAIVLAVVILIIVVLPAEYGIDPTGLGKSMGLTILAEPIEKTAKSVVGLCGDAAVLREDSVKLLIQPHSGLEYKFHLEKGAVLDYSWKTDSSAIYFDFHGEPLGDSTGYFKSYKEAVMAEDTGSKSAPFSGSHGWYWKNESSSTVNVLLETKGQYKVLGFR